MLLASIALAGVAFVCVIGYPFVRALEHPDDRAVRKYRKEREAFERLMR